jgi:hypothetical protein
VKKETCYLVFLKETLNSFQTPLSLYQTARCHIPKHNIQWLFDAPCGECKTSFTRSCALQTGGCCRPCAAVDVVRSTARSSQYCRARAISRCATHSRFCEPVPLYIVRLVLCIDEHQESCLQDTCFIQKLQNTPQNSTFYYILTNPKFERYICHKIPFTCSKNAATFVKTSPCFTHARKVLCEPR